MDEGLTEAVREEYGERADEVLDLLALYESDEPALVTRVRRAVVALSDSSVERVRHNIGVARIDYRDVLFWAETPPDPDGPTTYEEFRRRLGLGPEPDGP